jgi:hypothetical protein
MEGSLISVHLNYPAKVSIELEGHDDTNLHLKKEHPPELPPIADHRLAGDQEPLAMQTRALCEIHSMPTWLPSTQKRDLIRRGGIAGIYQSGH